MTINEPVVGHDANVSDPMNIGRGRLTYASGYAAGVVDVMVICEPIAAENTVPAYTKDYIKEHGVSIFNGSPNWTATYIDGAQCHPDNAALQWNALHALSVVQGYPPTATDETAVFRGVRAAFPHILTEAQMEDMVERTGGPRDFVDRVAELVDAWWERDVAMPQLPLREPADRDGRWLAYRNLPVDSPTGCVLGWRGKPLRASSLSVAVRHVDVLRKVPASMPLSMLQVGNPYGTGQAAINGGGVTWRSPGYPAFGVILFQDASASAAATVQAILSSHRKSPTRVYTDLSRPIRIGVNSPRWEDFANSGHIDLWVRVDSR